MRNKNNIDRQDTDNNYGTQQDEDGSALAVSNSSSPDFFVHQYIETPQSNYTINFADNLNEQMQTNNGSGEKVRGKIIQNQPVYQGSTYNTNKQLTPIQESESSRITKGKAKVTQDYAGYASFQNTGQDYQEFHQFVESPLDKSKHHQKKQQSIEQLRQSIEYLFLYYCDYSIDKGTVFIKQSNLVKLLKDANLLDTEGLTNKDVNLIVVQEMANPLLKSLDFQSFLNVIVKISMIKYPTTHPKSALAQLLDQYLIPLLVSIETSILDQNTQKIQSQLTSSGQYISNISLNTLQSIDVTNEDIVVFKSLEHVFKEIYNFYFNVKLKDHAMKKLFRFLRDFDICPFLINQKTCFLVYYFTVVLEEQDASIVQRMSEIQFMQQPKKKLGKDQSVEDQELSFDNFLKIIHRLAVIFSDSDSIPGQKCPNSSKKLIALLSRMELTKGFTDLVAKIRQLRQIDSFFALTPPHYVLIQLILNEQQFQSQAELEYYRDDVLPDLDNYQLCKLYLDSQPLKDPGELTQRHKDLQKQEQSTRELEDYLEQENDRLQQIFQYYCSHGDPLNTNKLKCTKFVKIFTDAGLVLNEPKDKGFNMSTMNKSDLSTKSSQNQRLKLDRNELALIFKKVAAQKTTKDKSNLFNNSKSTIINSKVSNIHQVQSATKQSKTLVKTIQVQIDQTYLNFEKFIQAMKETSKVVMKQTFNTDVDQYFVKFLQTFIVPLHAVQNDDKHLFNSRISSMLTQLEQEDVLVLLSDLYQVILPIYEKYANHKGQMDFTAFSRFCTHFSVFPDIINKSQMHRIFMNLAFEGSEQKDMSTILDRSQQFNKSTMRPMTSLSAVSTYQKQSQMIDSHLFVQALAFCGLHIELPKNQKILNQDQESLEKLFVFIEKIALSDGLKKLKMQNKEEAIKSIGQVERIDILQPFRKKYSWYFQQKTSHLMLDKTLKVKSTAFHALTLLDHKAGTQTLQLSARGPNLSSLSSRKNSHQPSNRHEFGVTMDNKQRHDGSRSANKRDLFSLVLQQHE